MAKSKEPEETHVLLQNCIIPGIGMCKAGRKIGKTKLNPSTWAWLGKNGFLKSIADIQREADEAEAAEKAAAGQQESGVGA